ncbi:MAG TPA: hypothetical protein VFC07_00165 [Verrucomicrobiae bacterium]|nr:hypothetical protein [Verrucomicrobiae bacterium]
MRRIHSNSIWDGLTPERRKMFEEWLFEERVSYREAVERAQQEWNVTGSLMSVSRFYKRVEQERMAAELAQCLEGSGGLGGTDAEMEGLWKSGLKVVVLQFYQKAMARGDTKDLATLGRLVSQNHLRETQRKQLELAREKFEFRAAKAALEQMALADEMRREEDEREEKRILAVKKGIFGKEMLKE